MNKAKRVLARRLFQVIGGLMLLWSIALILAVSLMDYSIERFSVLAALGIVHFIFCIVVIIIEWLVRTVVEARESRLEAEDE